MTDSEAKPGDESGDQSGSNPHTGMIFLAVTLGTGMVSYNSTAVITALPAIKDEFDLAATSLQWVMNIYMLMAAVLVAIMGRLADSFGHLRIFVAGMAAFVLGSLAVMAAPGFVSVLFGRAFQGIAASAMLATSLAILNKAVPEEKRAGAVGLWGSVLALGMGIGPLIGGALTDFVQWRAVFAIDMACVLAAIVIALAYVRKMGWPQHEIIKEHFDIPGLILLILFLGPLAFALTHGQASGWTTAPTLIPFAVALASLLAFLWIESRSTNPLIRLSFFKKPHYLAASIGIFLTGNCLLMLMYYYNLYIQAPEIKDFSALRAGATLLPMSGTMFIVSVVAPRVLAKVSFHWPLTFGMAMLCFGFWLLHNVDYTTPYSDIWWRLPFVGVGLGLCFPLLPRSGLRVLPDENAGQGSGVINTCLYFGCTLGTVIGGIVTARTVREDLTEIVTASPLTAKEHTDILHVLVHGTATQIEHAVEKLSGHGGADFHHAVRHAINAGYENVNLTGIVVAAVGLVLCLVLLRPEKKNATK